MQALYRKITFKTTAIMKKHIYTEAEKAEIIRLYPHRPTNEIALLLGIPVASVYSLADRLGIKKSPAYLKRLRSEMSRRLADSGAAHRFSKGQVPANKGKKMSTEVYAKVSATMFKKGHMPGNTLYDGAESIRNDKNGHQYIWVRVSLGKWVPKHVLLWQQSHGPVPKGHNIVFRDGNTLNCTPENLECISNAELMQRNSLHNLPEEVKELIYLKGRLSRAINESNNQ